MINIDNDNSLLTTGVWTEYEGSRFLVTHMSNVAFQRALLRRQAPYKTKIDKGTLDPITSRELMMHAMSEGLILDWDKVVDGKGDKVPFSKEVCFKALKNNEGLRDYLSEFAMNLDNFREAEKEALGKS
jgi:hypothetical protein